MTVIKSTVKLAIAAVIIALFGFIRDIVIAAMHGADVVSDAFLLAYSIPVVLLGGIGYAVANVLLPQYSRTEPNEKNLFFSNVINLILIVAIGLSLVFMLIPHVPVFLFASQIDTDVFDLTVSFLRITIWIAVPQMLVSSLQIYLDAKGIFFAPRITTLCIPICIIAASMVSAAVSNIYMLPISLLLGYTLYAITLIVMVVKQGFTYRPYININDKKVKTMLPLILPLLISMIGHELHHIIDKNFASTLATGTITLMVFAFRISIQFNMLVGTSIALVMYPRMVQIAGQGKHSMLAEYCKKYLQKLLPVVLPFTIGLFFLAEPIMYMLFERGAFTQEDTRIAGTILRMYAIGICFRCFNSFFSRIFAAVEDTKTPARSYLLSLVIGIILNFILIRPLQHIGLALSTSIATAANTGLLLWALRKRFGSLGLISLKIEYIKTLAATIIMGIIVWLGSVLLPIMGGGHVQAALLIFTLSVVGACIYASMHAILRTMFWSDGIKITVSILNKIRK